MGRRNTYGARFFFIVLASLIATAATAKTYQVGPSRSQKSLSNSFMSSLKAGDVVEIDGDHTYAGFEITQSGTAANPITIRGIRVNGKRPVFQSSGGFTVHVNSDGNANGANYNVIEGLEITGGHICFRHYGANTILRDSEIHHCTNGILGTDYSSGPLTVEYTEIHDCGSGDQHHQIYMTTNAAEHPGSVFRLQYSYIHSGVGGNNVKTRSERNEIYYNWIEGAFYHELELIGPDADVYDPRGETLPREDSDIVGNVLRSATNTAWCTIRVGGDGTGGTAGRYRFVNNTFLIPSSMTGAVFRHFSVLESIEMHNNVFYAEGGGGLQVALQQGLDANWDEREEDVYVWSTGKKVIAGTNNWIPAGSTGIPSQWTGTLTGTDPGFENLSGYDLRPTASSPLVDKGATSTASAAGYDFPNPQVIPLFSPPAHVLLEVGTIQARPSVGTMDIGAYEYGTGPPNTNPGTGGSGGGTGGSGGTGGTGGSGGSGGTGGIAGSGGAGGSPPPDAGADGNVAQDNLFNGNNLNGGCAVMPDPSTGAGLLLLGFAVFWTFRRRSSR